jgi:Spy/CpxP family protein refolding chaperone
MNQQPTSTPHRHYLRRLAPLALIAGIALGSAATVLANGAAGMASHHGSAAGNMGDHVEQMLQHVYAEIDVSDAQKAQIDPLVQQAKADLAPLHAELHDGHADMLALLGADSIDRAGIEALRVEHIRAMDQASQRITQLIEDIADVLTPAQRKALAARIAEHHGQAQE